MFPSLHIQTEWQISTCVRVINPFLQITQTHRTADLALTFNQTTNFTDTFPSWFKWVVVLHHLVLERGCIIGNVNSSNSGIGGYQTIVCAVVDKLKSQPYSPVALALSSAKKVDPFLTLSQSQSNTNLPPTRYEADSEVQLSQMFFSALCTVSELSAIYIIGFVERQIRYTSNLSVIIIKPSSQCLQNKTDLDFSFSTPDTANSSVEAQFILDTASAACRRSR